MKTKQTAVERIEKAMASVLKWPQNVLSQLYDCDMRQASGIDDLLPERGERSRLTDELTVSLERACRAFAIYLERLSLEHTRSELLAQWDVFKREKLSKVDWWHTDDDDGLQSEPLELLETIHWSVKKLTKDGSDLPDAEPPDIGRLEYVLKCTGRVLRNLNITPQREQDIQDAMGKHLENVFEDFTRKVMIAKPVANFKPDGGIICLRAAIEFKFCNTEESVKTALRGLTEDLSGYAGSHDWTRFYSVVYQTEAFTVEDTMRSALMLSGNAHHWKTILITGGKTDQPAATAVSSKA